MNFDNISSPPVNSAVSVQHHHESVQFSGASHSFSQEALRKKMPTIKAPSHSVEEALASLPWTLKITPNKVKFSQEQLVKMNDDQFCCRPQDVRRLSVSPDGYVMAHLSGRTSEESAVPLTGSLSAADADWLRNTLSDLLEAIDSNQQSASTSKRDAVTAIDEQHLPNDCRLVSSGSSGHLVIHHLSSVDTVQKVAVTVIYLIFGAAFGGLPLYYASINIEQIRALPLPHWAALLGIVITIVFAIAAKRKSIAKQARASRGKPRDNMKALSRRALTFGIVGLVQLAIVMFVLRDIGKLTETPMHVWLAALALIAGIGFVSYFVWLILWLLFGRTVFVATEQLLRIRKKLVFPMSSGMIHRSDLESFELMELVHVNDGREVRYWGLDANLSDSAVRLLPKEIDFETADWLGRTLAGWFGVSFARAHETEAIRSRYYEELG